MSKILKANSYKSEVDTTVINYKYSGVINQLSYTNCTFIVKGTVYHIETNTELFYEKSFTYFEDAQTYLISMTKAFPYSSVILKKLEYSEILKYD